MTIVAIDKEIAGVIKRTRAPWPTPKLYVIELPAGRVPGFSIDYAGDQLKRYDSSEWLSKGFDGVLFRGAGRQLTTIVDNPGYQRASVFIGPHNGVVAFEGLTIETSEDCAIQAGVEKPQRFPKFQVRLQNVHVQARPTTLQGIRSVWGLFTFGADTWLEDVSFNCTNTTEHASYSHGYALRGSRWVRVTVQGSGAENDKHATRPWEMHFTPNASIYRADCTYQNWNQPWTWRGGAGIVVQGAAADVVVERCVFYGGKDASHCRCVMIDDGQVGIQGHYGMDGSLGGFPANGWIILNDCGVSGSGTLGTSSPVVRVGTVYGESRATARGFLMEDCGAYGKLAVMQIANVPTGRIIVRRCNTEGIESTCAAHGFDTSSEVMIPLKDKLLPVSAGWRA